MHHRANWGIERREPIAEVKNAGMPQGSDSSQELLGIYQLRELLLIRHKFLRVHTPPAATKPDWMLQMKHFVENDVFDGIARDSRVVEDTAYDDGIVGGVVVAEAVAGVFSAPGELRASHQAVEEAAVEVVKDFFQMVVAAASRVDMFASAHLADEARFRADFVARDIAAVTSALSAVNGLAVQLSQENVG